MSAAALLVQQPVAFWLAVVGVLVAGALALGSRMAVVAALAAGLGAVVAVVDPGASAAQAVAAFVGAAAVTAAALARSRRAPRAEAPMESDVRLLGRTARTRGPFVGGDGEVEVDGALRPARALAPDEVLDGGVLVRIVRVGEPALVVRPVASAA